MTKYPTVTIRISDYLLTRLNLAAKRRNISRSTLIKTAIMLYLALEYEEESPT